MFIRTFTRNAKRLALLTALTCSACLTPPVTYPGSPDAELEAVLAGLERAREADFRVGRSEAQGHGGAREARWIREARGLALQFPRHVPTLVANGALAYERRDFIGAQKYLDQALWLEPDHRQAILLRVRVAAEGGNLPFAQRKLREQLVLAPQDPDLREAYGGVLYLLGDYEAALRELDAAEKLGQGRARTSRIQYHRGLVAEALGDLELARERYRSSTELEPDFEPAARRFLWLESLRHAGGAVEAAHPPETVHLQ